MKRANRVAAGKVVSAELSTALDKLAGIPAGKDDAALQILRLQGLGEGPIAQPVAFGMWFGGCYYVRSRRGTRVGSGGRRWRLIKCIA